MRLSASLNTHDSCLLGFYRLGGKSKYSYKKKLIAQNVVFGGNVARLLRWTSEWGLDKPHEAFGSCGTGGGVSLHRDYRKGAVGVLGGGQGWAG